MTKAKRRKIIKKIALWTIVGIVAIVVILGCLVSGKFLQFTITGISVGAVYALIALGFALIWKASGVANLALGQIVLISSWFTYAMMVQVELPQWLAFPAVIVFAIFLGWIIERFALRPLIAQPILSLITVTLGLGYFLEGVVTLAWPQSLGNLRKQEYLEGNPGR